MRTPAQPRNHSVAQTAGVLRVDPWKTTDLQGGHRDGVSSFHQGSGGIGDIVFLSISFVASIKLDFPSGWHDTGLWLS